MLAAYGGELRRLFNTSGKDYREQKLGEKLPDMSESAALALLAGNGNLVKRPFLLGGRVALVGFDEAVWLAALLKKMNPNPRSRPHLELRLRELAQLFNSLDPSPFVDRDLDRDAEEFIVGWAVEVPGEREYELVVHLAVPPPADRAAGTEDAVQRYFASRSEMKGRELRQLLRQGRISLFVGLLFLGGCYVLSMLIGRLGLLGAWSEVGKEGLAIVGWVAMWRPLEIYLYDWWPLHDERKMFRRLARMSVRLVLPPAAIP